MRIFLYPSARREESFFYVCEGCLECPPSGVPYVKAAVMNVAVAGDYSCLECGVSVEVIGDLYVSEFVRGW